MIYLSYNDIIIWLLHTPSSIILFDFRAESLYETMKTSYGVNNVFYLNINSQISPSTDTHLPDPWSQFLVRQVHSQVTQIFVLPQPGLCLCLVQSLKCCSFHSKLVGVSVCWQSFFISIQSLKVANNIFLNDITFFF